MSKPTVIATVSGPAGFETCYVSFKSVVASDGALTGTPTVTSAATSLVTIADEELNFAGTINGVSYAAGEVLTFKATRVGSSKGTVPVDIAYQTPKRQETLRVLIALADYEV